MSTAPWHPCRGRVLPALLLAAALLAAAPRAWAQACAVTGAATPQPEWVTRPGEAPDTLFAVGVAEARGAASLDAVRDAARSRALAEMAQQIQAEVSARVTETLQKVSAGGRTQLSETFGSSTEVVSRLALRNLQVDQQWADVPGCRLWLRVRLPRAEAERARAIATSDAAAAALRQRMALAGDGQRGATERAAALAEARELARLADPALTPGFSRDAFELQAAELGGTLAAVQGREQQYKAQITSHVQAMAQANASAAGAPRRALLAKALAALDTATGLAPAGVPGYALPFKAEDRVAALHAELGAPCSGRLWFERRNLALPAALATTTGCDAPRVARERRTLYLDGKSVALDCSLAIDGRREPWPKACSALQSALAAEGATLVAAGAPAEVRIELRAEGTVQERKDAESGRSGWRFQGKLRSSARGPSQLDIADDYEGLTGWNPVSSQMAADLLALGAVKRLDTALLRFWEAR